jgi:hypothetical protein
MMHRVVPLMCLLVNRDGVGQVTRWSSSTIEEIQGISPGVESGPHIVKALLDSPTLT